MMPNGDTYVGGFKNGKFHGKGLYRQLENEVKYEGWYKDGLKDGFGVMFVDYHSML
jgi:hypothetical protein